MSDYHNPVAAPWAPGGSPDHSPAGAIRRARCLGVLNGILPPRPLHRQRLHLDHVPPYASHRHNPAVDVPVNIAATQWYSGTHAAGRARLSL